MFLFFAQTENYLSLKLQITLIKKTKQNKTNHKKRKRKQNINGILHFHTQTAQDLGCPSGVRVSQRWGASWVSASSSQSCLSDSGSRRDCKNDNLKDKIYVKFSSVGSSLPLAKKWNRRRTCAPLFVTGPDYPGMPGSGVAAPWSLHQQELWLDRTGKTSVQPPPRASHTAWIIKEYNYLIMSITILL